MLFSVILFLTHLKKFLPWKKLRRKASETTVKQQNYGYRKRSKSLPIMTLIRAGIKSNSFTDSSDSSSDESPRLLKRRSSSFKQICEFSVTFCLKGSEDLKSRLDVFLQANSSTLEVIEKHFKQIQHALPYLLVSVVLLILASEMYWCLSLISEIPFEPGFCFLFILVIIVCVGINGGIMTHLLQSPSSPLKDKSKEV